MGKYSLRLERHSIDYIPPNQRHGKASDLIFLWFGANAQMAVVATGLMVVVPGFSLTWAVLGIVIGTLIGTIFMAYHSAQGPHLGIPQMIQSRAQFGYYGAVIPLVMVVLMYLGFYAAGAVIGAQALAMLLHVTVGFGILISSAAVFLLVLAGYNMIHKFNRWMSYLFTAVFAVVTVLLIIGSPVGHTQVAATSAVHPGFILGPFLLSISLAVINTLGYAPYVADYSRYLPQRTTVQSTFWYTYIGIVTSNSWMMILGALMQSRAPSSDVLKGFAALALTLGPWFRIFVLLAAALGIVSINALNIYGGFMSSLTITSTFLRRLKPTLSLRVWFIIPITIIGTYLAFLEKGSLLSSFDAFLGVLIDFLVPWTAINLTDYYFVRKGKYNIPDIFRPGGRYGKFNWMALFAYMVGFLVEMPFMNTTLHEGVIAKMLHGGDISWVVGVLVAGAIYLFAAKRPAVSASAATHQNTEESTSRVS
ncbi:purine-cytosine permease family protein [Alicyclobacillus mengziensis]|uniref:Cytosine permease n=1 Tax=Alicyclobacillus mengziensis TaxID=2931921 RepID=A0A9X7VVR0_9BACL|nr:cytosine permease [Alicyclobacillus mengziensis]QSO45832.1 cytosine permease [Alicyclobacillus mengziensis]